MAVTQESEQQNTDIPKVINLPEGASQEEMVDIIKQQIEGKGSPSQSDVPAVGNDN
jgi:hypothetical protein